MPGSNLYRLRVSFLHGGIVPVLALVLFSCASPTAEVETDVVKTAVSEPKGKPVKMPPRLEIEGSSNGIAIDDFFALQQTGGALIYDVRVPYFYKIDRIPGAINWPHDKYDEQVQARDLEIQEALNGGKKVVIYCFNFLCPEARNVAKKLARRDYNVHVFTAGIDSWRDAGLPLDISSSGNSE